MKVLSTFIKDLKVSFKTFYIYIELIMAFIFIAVLLFVIPENFTANEVIYASIDDGVSSNRVVDELENNDTGSILFVDTKEAILRSMEENRNSAGVIVSTEDQKLSLNIILQGYENQRHRNMMEKSLMSYMAKELPQYQRVTNITTLNENREVLNDRINLLPLFLLLNSAFTGLLIVAAYIFMDKEEGTVKAFAVTPAKVWQYLLSKMGMMLVTGLITGVLTALFVAGSHGNYLHLVLLLMATNAFGTAVGLLISSFYDSIIKAMGAIFVVIIMFAFASTSYFMPSFSPLVLRILPSYPMLFAFREVFLQQPNTGYIYYNILGFSLLALLFFLWANHRFKKTLTV